MFIVAFTAMPYFLVAVPIHVQSTQMAFASWRIVYFFWAKVVVSFHSEDTVSRDFHTLRGVAWWEGMIDS